MTAEERIRNIFGNLYLKEPLYQMVSLTHRLVMDKKIETIGVWKKEIHYNPDFIGELSDGALQNVLFNELDRILLRHPYERKKKNPVAMFHSSNLTLAEHGRNLGQVKVKDLYEYIQSKGYSEDQQKFMKLYEAVANLSDEELKRRTGFTREKLEKIIERIKLPELDTMLKRHMEYYYNLLDKYIEPMVVVGGIPVPGEDESGQGDNKGKGKGRGKGKNEGDSEKGDGEGNGKARGKGKAKGDPDNSNGDGANGGGGEGERRGMDRYNNPQNPSEISENWDEDPIIENEIENAIREAQITGQWGSVGGAYQEALLASLKPKVNYKSILKQFRQRVLSSNTTLNRMRPNRRFGFGFPGRKHEYTTKLAWFIDTSGSVSSKALADCFGTINNIFAYGVQELDVYYFDTKLQNNKKPVKITKALKEYKPSGRGGTDFQVVFNFLSEKDAPNYDGIIVFTDGECYTPNLKGINPADICWLIDSEKHYEGCKDNLSKVGRIAFVKSEDEET